MLDSTNMSSILFILNMPLSTTAQATGGIMNE